MGIVNIIISHLYKAVLDIFFHQVFTTGVKQKVKQYK